MTISNMLILFNYMIKNNDCKWLNLCKKSHHNDLKKKTSQNDKNHETQFSNNSMFNDEIRKKLKNTKKNDPCGFEITCQTQYSGC